VIRTIGSPHPLTAPPVTGGSIRAAAKRAGNSSVIGESHMNARSLLLAGRRRLRRVTIPVAAAAALAFTMLALPSGTPAAQATPVPNGCLSHHEYLCTWQNSNYSGTEWIYPEFGSGQGDGYWWYVGSAANDQISSLYNYTLSYAYVAKDCPADSQWTYLGIADGAPNLANSEWPNLSGMNDSISAWSIGPDGETKPVFPDHGSRMNGGC
jgi:hypothetical protein